MSAQNPNDLCVCGGKREVHEKDGPPYLRCDEFEPVEGPAADPTDAAAIEQAAFDRGHAAGLAEALAFLKDIPETPPHHGLCHKDGCLGFDGGCPRVTFERGVAIGHTRMRTVTDGIRTMHAAEVDSLRAEIAGLKKRLDLCVADEPTGVYQEGEAAGYKRAIATLRDHDAPIARACANLLEDAARRPQCPECGGDLGGVEIGRIEDHRAGCSRLPR